MLKNEIKVHQSSKYIFLDDILANNPGTICVVFSNIFIFKKIQASSLYWRDLNFS